MVPNVELAFRPFAPGTKVAFGSSRFTLFKRLNDSARNCIFHRSRMCVFLITEKSRPTVPGARTSGSVRATLPIVKGGGLTNCVTSNHSYRVGFDNLALVPVEFG